MVRTSFGLRDRKIWGGVKGPNEYLPSILEMLWHVFIVDKYNVWWDFKNRFYVKKFWIRVVIALEYWCLQRFECFDKFTIQCWKLLSSLKLRKKTTGNSNAAEQHKSNKNQLHKAQLHRVVLKHVKNSKHLQNVNV